jgi:mannose-6-phosphate isomerase-like protein (cupin superfamily)
MHHHEKWSQMFFVIDGEMTFDTGQERFTLKRGESVLFDPREPHHTLNESRKDSLCLVVTVAQG